MLKLAQKTLLLALVLGAAQQAASTVSAASLFHVAEWQAPHAGAALVAAKCGTATCGGAEKHEDHKCGSKPKAGDHQCGGKHQDDKKKGGDHQCGSKPKAGDHQCGGKPHPDHQ